MNKEELSEEDKIAIDMIQIIEKSDYIQKRYISRNKVEEKIKELEMEYKKPYNDYEKLSFAIDILKDLLED